MIYYFPEDDILFEKMDTNACRSSTSSRTTMALSMVEVFQNFLEAHDPFFLWLTGPQQKQQYVDQVLLERFLQLKPNCRFLYRQEGKLSMYDYLKKKKDREKVTNGIMRVFHYGFRTNPSYNDIVENTIEALDVASLSLTVTFFRDQGILEDVLRADDKRFIQILKGVLRQRVGSKLQSGSHVNVVGFDMLRAVVSISVPCTFAFLQQHYPMIMFGEPLPPLTAPFTIISEAAFGIPLSPTNDDNDDDDDDDDDGNGNGNGNDEEEALSERWCLVQYCSYLINIICRASRFYCNT